MRLALVVVCALVTVAQADDSEDVVRKELVDAIVAGNVAALRGADADPIEIDGLWFTNAACAKQFSTSEPRKVDDALVPALLKCLHGEHLAPTRDSLSIDAIVYGPEANISVIVNKGVVSITSVSTVLDGARYPVLWTKKLEGHRASGSAVLAVDEATKELAAKDTKQVAFARVTFCIDPKGALNHVTVAAQPKKPGYEAYVTNAIAQISAWKFKPFMAGKTAVTVCSEFTTKYPEDRAYSFEDLLAPNQ